MSKKYINNLSKKMLTPTNNLGLKLLTLGGGWSLLEFDNDIIGVVSNSSEIPQDLDNALTPDEFSKLLKNYTGYHAKYKALIGDLRVLHCMFIGGELDYEVGYIWEFCGISMGFNILFGNYIDHYDLSGKVGIFEYYKQENTLKDVSIFNTYDF